MSTFRSWRKKLISLVSLSMILFSLIPSAALATPPDFTLSVSPTTINPSNGEKAYFDWNLVSTGANMEVYIYDKDPIVGGTVQRTVLAKTAYNVGHPAPIPYWDGKIIKKIGQIDTLIYGPSGNYQYLVRASTANGQEFKLLKGTVTLDYSGNNVVQPVIGSSLGNDNNDYATPNPFDPSPAKNEKAKIMYSLNIMPSSLSVDIWQGATKLKTFGNAPKKDGWNEVDWDGLKPDGTPYPEGTYTYTINATNYSGNSVYTDNESGSVAIKYTNAPITTPQITNLTATPNPFDPDNSSTNIRYNLNMNVDTATVQILDGNSIIETLVNPGKLQNENVATWDGLKPDGTRYPEKTYTYQINVAKYVGNSTYTDSKTGTVTISYNGDPVLTPQITGNSANPNPFDQNTESTNISFNLDRAAYVTIRILDGNQVVNTIMTAAYRSIGSNSKDWNGKDTAGIAVDDGTYTYEIKACNTSNMSVCSTKTGTVVANSNAPAPSGTLLSNVVVNNSNFNPDDGEESEVCFDVERSNVDVTVKVMKGSSTKVWLEDQSNFNTGNNQCVSWNGEDDNNDVVSDGSYTFYVLAEKSGYSDETYSKTVTVDTNGGSNGNLISNIDVNNTSFNPDDSEESEICFDVEKDNVKVVLDMIDDSGDTVVNLKNKTYNSQTNLCVTWDGQDDNNDVVSDGTYRFRIKATRSGDTQTEYENVEVDTNGSSNNGTLIRNFKINKHTINPDDKEKTQICFDIRNDNTKITLEVRDGNDRIRKILSHEYDKTTNFCGSWDGRDDDNVVVDDGTYQIRLIAERGSDDQTNTANVIIDTNGSSNGDCSFLDSSEFGKYQAALDWACKEKIFNGYQDDYMRPYQEINRYETTKVIAAYNNIAPLSNDSSNAGYWDVEKGSWPVGWLRAVKQYGIHGNPDGSFRGFDTVNNVELARIAVEVGEITLPHCNYAPYNKNVWFNDYWCMIKKDNLVDSDRPGELMTRGDVALMLYRLNQLGN